MSQFSHDMISLAAIGAMWVVASDALDLDIWARAIGGGILGIVYIKLTDWLCP